jgi:transposase
MTGNSKIFEGMDEAAREFARELEELLNPDAAQAEEAAEAPRQPDQRQEAQPAREPSERQKELEDLRRKLKRLRIAATLAKSSLSPPT